MELAKLFTELFVELLAELLVELKAWVELRHPKELEVFNSLRLSVVVLIEVLLEVFIDVAGRTKFIEMEFI